MSGIGLSDLKAALSDHTRTVSQGNWQVGSGATTTSIPVELVNPAAGTVGLSAKAQTDLTGATIEFRSGKNAGQTFGVTAVSSSGTLTLDAALPYAPAQGDSFVLIQPMEISVTAPENVAQWGGVAVEAADTNGVPKMQQAYTEAAPGTAVPARALQIGMTDGTDLRAWSGDNTGVGKVQGGYTEAATGTAAPSHTVQIGGSDGTDLRTLATDSSGNAKTNIVSVGSTTLPTGQSGNPNVPVTLDGSTFKVPTDHESTLQLTVDSTTTALAASGTYTTSAAVNVSAMRRVFGTVISDQSGTLYVQQSPDGSNWDVQSSFSVAANDAAGQGTSFSVDVAAPSARLHYVNGATAQTVFRLYAWAAPEA